MEYSRCACYKFRHFARLFVETVVEAIVELEYLARELILLLVVTSRCAWTRCPHWPPHGEEAHDWTVHHADRS